MLCCDNFKCEAKISCKRYRKNFKAFKHLEHNDWIFHSYEKEKCKVYWEIEK